MKYLVGIRPTGQLHLGHYFSVIKPALKYNADVLVADYHAPDTNANDLIEFNKKLKKLGLKTKLQKIDTLLYFKLLNLASLGELQRMTQYKSSSAKDAHLLCYPVLMACDLIGYDFVIVGDDQKQHIELAKELVRKYRNKYKINLKFPIPVYEGGKILSLKDSSKKMSKSEPESCLFLNDLPEVKKKKIMKAVTDKAGRTNLEVLYKEFVGKEVPKLNKDLKEQLAEVLIVKFN